MKQINKLVTALAVTSSLHASEDNIWITEVLPATGQIEVTNVGEEAFTTTRPLIFCHRFNYNTSIPTGTSFEPGESIVYTVTFTNTNASDLWLYNSRRFGISSDLLNGLQWNTNSNIGRTGVATQGAKWDSTSASAPAPAAGQSIQLTGEDPFSSENWTVGEPNLGTFGNDPEETDPADQNITVQISQAGNMLTLEWQGGTPPYQVEVSNDLQRFEPLGPITNDLTTVVEISERSQFYRVVAANRPQTARYNIQFSSLWSGITFVPTPSDPTFGSLTGATHNEQFSLWQPGEIASNGVGQIASDGSVALLSAEIGFAMSATNADQIILGSSIDQELGTETFQISVNRDFPLLSLVSKLSNSPDWFTGIQGFNFIDENGNFLDRIEIMLMPWDAGVDEASLFNAPASLPTLPTEPISSLAGEFPFIPSPFLEDIGALPIGALTIERIIE